MCPLPTAAERIEHITIDDSIENTYKPRIHVTATTNLGTVHACMQLMMHLLFNPRRSDFGLAKISPHPPSRPSKLS